MLRISFITIFAATLFAVLVNQCANAAVCSSPSSYAGKVVCDSSGSQCGQCVSFVKICSKDNRQTTAWKKGIKVKGASIPVGTAIATFNLNNGQNYDSHSVTPGKGHAAIYISQNPTGILVWDQWVGHPVATRTIRFKGGAANTAGNSDDGDQFYVIN